MIKFEFRDCIAEGVCRVNLDTGKTTQNCSIVMAITGLPNGEELLTKSVTFIVDNTLSVIDAWLDIRDNQAPKWVEDNYSI